MGKPLQLLQTFLMLTDLLTTSGLILQLGLTQNMLIKMKTKKTMKHGHAYFFCVTSTCRTNVFLLQKPT